MKLSANEKGIMTKFQNAFSDGIEKIAEASKIYVNAIDRNPDLKIKFQENFEGSIPLSAWASFERVGRGEMHYKLLYGGGKNASFIKKLAYSDQEDILNGTKLAMMLANGDSLMVDPREVTKLQAQQIFNGDTIRSLDQQKAYIEGLKSLKAIDESQVENHGMPYTIHGGKLTVVQGGTFNKREFKRMYKEFIGK